MQTRNNRGRGISLIFIALMILMVMLMFARQDTATENYSEIVAKFQNQQVTEFTLDLTNGSLTYKLTGDSDKDTHTYAVPDVDLFLSDIRDTIDAYDQAHPDAPMKYNYKESANWGTILVNVLPILLLVGMGVVFFMMMNQQGGGKIGNIGKARTHGPEADGRRATFADVAGADEEKEELTEIVEYLKNPSRFNALGAKIPKGVLLVGPPGTGKTLLARAVAGEAGVPFYSISGSDFVELYVGVGASRVRDLFDKAKKTRPSIIFIDEIDAVGRQRGAGLGGGHDEREQTLNQLLVEMDGFTGNDGVIVMAATNRADILDHALLRPGRFDRQVYVGYPDVKGREAILKVHGRGKPMGPDVDFSIIAKTTVGFTGADLENLLNEAALLAARRQKKAITMAEIEEASIKVIAGPEKKSRVVSDKERRVAAYHEAGHAVATHIATPETPVHQISIVPRGMMGGYTMSLPEEDSMLKMKGEMEGEIVTLLGGRVAEQTVFDDISTGASNDLERATSIAHNMVTKYGFSEKLGPVVYGSHDEVFLGRDFTQSRNYSDQVANEIDNEIRDIVETAYDRCRAIIEEHMPQLEAVAQYLIANEKVDGEIFKKLMNGEKVEPPQKAAQPAATITPPAADDVAKASPAAAGDGESSAPADGEDLQLPPDTPAPGADEQPALGASGVDIAPQLPEDKEDPPQD